MKSFLGRFIRKEDEVQPPAAPAMPSPTEAPEPSAGDKPLRRTGISVKPPEEPTRPAVPPPPPPPRDEDSLLLELGDFLHRIPANLLKPGTPDVHTEIRFDLADVSERIARGETAIPLSEIYDRVPQIFSSEVREEDGVLIRFPWQKVLKLINETAPGKVPSSALSVAAAESLAYKLKTRHVTRNIPTGRGAGGLNAPESPLGKAGSKLAQKPVTWFTRPSSPTPAASAAPSAAPAEPPQDIQAEAKPAPLPLNERPSPEEQAVQDSTALIETIREEYERDMVKERGKWEQELVAIRQDYDRQIEELRAELTALKAAGGSTSATAK